MEITFIIKGQKNPIKLESCMENVNYKNICFFFPSVNMKILSSVTFSASGQSSNKKPNQQLLLIHAKHQE
jgi:hypothetical protein